jgi:polysaccharide pyruvyl transferase CsaB
MRITLSGYYGCGNTGDEAVLAGIVDSFRVCAAVPRESFVVLSGDVHATRALHGLDALPRMRLSAVRRSLKSSDLLISGGGSLIQDATSVRSAVYYLAILRMAAMCGTPTVLYAQGVGPLRRGITRWLARLAVDRVELAMVRDEASAELLREIGVRRPPIEVVADPAFALEAAPAADCAAVLQRAGIAPGERFVGVALRPWADGPGDDVWAATIRAIAQTTGAGVLLLPMQPPGDTEMALRLAAHTPASAVVRDALAPRVALGLVRAMTGLVAMRLHALVFGATGGVPLVGISYDPKVRALMRSLGQYERCVDIGAIEPIAVAGSLAAAIDKGADLRGRLLAVSAKMRDLALGAVESALSVAARR